jgi:hypothetical protein
MIRGGIFGFNFNLKLIFIGIALFCCIYDIITKRRLDYVWVFIVGTIIWTGFESFMFFTGARSMPSAVLLGFDIPPIIYIPLMGMSERALSYIGLGGKYVATKGVATVVCALRKDGILCDKLKNRSKKVKLEMDRCDRS